MAIYLVSDPANRLNPCELHSRLEPTYKSAGFLGGGTRWRNEAEGFEEETQWPPGGRRS